jgi:hypothetical protein
MTQSPPIESNPPPARSQLSNSESPLSNPAESSPQKIPGAIKPLFCCSVSPEGFFKFYTIFLIVCYGADFIGAMLFSFKTSPLVGVFGLLSDVPMLVLSSIAYSKYDDTGNYAQSLHYCLAITVMVMTCLSLVSVALTPVFLFAFGLGDTIMGVFTSENKGFAWMALSLYTVIVVPLSFYNAYLSYLYFKVISWKRGEGAKEELNDTQNLQELEEALADETNQNF